MAHDALTNLDEQALTRLGADLRVPARAAGEGIDQYRARVARAFNDDAAVDAAETMTTRPRFRLGGMKLGGK